MPPKKDKPSKIEYRTLLREKGIRLKGPASPSEWPRECRRQFRIIRSIESTRYEDYAMNEKIPLQQRDHFKNRVFYLREKAYEYLDDGVVNEATWRHLEHKILERFDNPVICRNCKHELWKSDNEAEYSHPQEQLSLDAKRRARMMCHCKGESATSKAEDSDDEHGTVFDFANDARITHIPDDDLQSLSISMQPDCVVGLRVPSRVPHNDSYFPVTRKRIFLPFLVVEAKREVDAPGFRAIQYQTAFPLRRLLSAQQELYAQGNVREPCLVWFFAYQGEQWRVNAGFRRDNKVRIYDLWQGTIQSQDGALQLLLIVDYIFSWARDIYRPTIRKILFDTMASLRDFSPASTDQFRQSVSLSTTSSPTLTMRSLDWHQSTGIVRADGTSRPSFSNVSFSEVRDESQSSQQQQPSVLTITRTHSLLQWAVGHERAPLWTAIGSIRHADVIQFEFECHIANNREFLRDSRKSLELLSQFPVIAAEGLEKIAKIWTNRSPPALDLIEAATFRAMFLFQTYCDPLTWQIKRVLKCVLWPANSSSHALQTVHDTMVGYQRENLERAILSVQQLHGRDSVWFALRNVTRVLLLASTSNQVPTWSSFGELEQVYGSLLEGVMHPNPFDPSVRLLYQDYALLQIQRSFSRQHQSPDLGVARDTRTGSSMLAIRSQSWSHSCPRFCLFISLEIVPNSEDELSLLLEEAKSMKNYYGEGDIRFTHSDWDALRAWRKALTRRN